jgi:roadblock/LC7 domain-containing protein
MSFSWKAVLGAVAPAAAEVLENAIPGGKLAVGILAGLSTAIFGKSDATQEQIAQAVQAGLNPQQQAAVVQVEVAARTEMARIAAEQEKAELAAETQEAGDINATMQAEAKAEHWPTYSWRPAVGFAVALAVLLAVLSIMVAYGGMLLADHPEHYAQLVTELPQILASVALVIGMVSPILGIAAWHRGKMQVEQAKSGS